MLLTYYLCDIVNSEAVFRPTTTRDFPAGRRLDMITWVSVWKRFPMLYEVRGYDEGRMFAEILKVLDQEKLPLNIQYHGNPMRFRNIWVREIKPAVALKPEEKKSE